MNENNTTNTVIDLTEDEKDAFIKAMKIGYYKEFYKQELITAEQLEQLIEMQDRKD